MVTVEGFLEAYTDCWRNKRATQQAIDFEYNVEEEIVRLVRSINARKYLVSPSYCFIVRLPRYREVFAAAFRDRVVHHYIALRLEPLMEEVFGDRTFNCRKGKGQLYGVEMLADDIKECSDNYTADCYIARLDIQSFFMSVSKTRLANLVDGFILKHYKGDDIEDLRYLCRVVIMNCPEKNCILRSPKEMWNYIPAEKSKFYILEDLGLPIGNLPSQHFANLLLNILDWYLEELGFKYHGRYVDDFYIVDKDRNKILNAIPKVREKLSELGLKLHPHKFYFQHYSKGMAFTGYVVKRNRIYVGNRSVHGLMKAVEAINNAKGIEELKSAVSSANSYLGMFRHANGYTERRKILGRLKKKVFRRIYIKGHFDSIALKPKYRERTQTLKKIKRDHERYRRMCA